ncbi:hypothetical protein MHM582_0372, partial [Microbacterium sp. HM58-2]
MGGTFDM